MAKRGLREELPDLTHIAAGLRDLATPIEHLHPDPANARTHNEKSIAAIADSMAAFGQDQPVIVQKEGSIIRKGNGRLAAARLLLERGDLRWKYLAALFVDESDLTATRRAIADNRSSELSSWEPNILAMLLTTIRQSEEPDTQALGFTEDEVAALLEAPIVAQLGDMARTPESDGDAAKPDLYAGYKQFQVLLSTEQEMTVRAAVAAVKKQHGFETTAEALAHICKGVAGADSA